MVFSTIEFIFIFLPIVLFFYYLTKKEYTNGILLVSSLIFYYLGAQNYLFLLLIMIALVYLEGLLIEKYHHNNILGISISSILVVLIIFKYYDFFINNINSIFHTNILISNIVMPLGISFFTFQMISYLVDVYRGEKAQRNIINLALYISFFPQLIAGPIVRYKDIKKYIEKKNRTWNLDQVSNGLWRFSIGLCKKVILANNLAVLSDIVFNSKEIYQYSLMYSWLGAIAFSLQIYYDFSAYSDMAIGLAEIFGFKIKENFNYPYAAKSIKDFWKRWHISLSSFFRDYIYIPLGGNKYSKWKYIRNILIVWLLTGFWHGPNWTYILWGISYGLLIILESHLNIKNKYFQYIQRILSLIIIILLWVLFRSNTITDAFQYITSMFYSNCFIDKAFLFQFSNYKILLLISILFIFPIVPMIKEKYQDKRLYKVLSSILLLLGVIISISLIMMQGYNPFLYFIF